MRSFAAAVLALVLAACGPSPVEAPAGRYVAVGAGAVELSFPADWRENDKEHPFDLQWFSGDKSLTTGVFQWARSDLAADVDGERLLQMQVEDMRGKRTDFREAAPRATEERDGRRLTTLVYMGEKQVSRFYYRFTLVEFPAHPEDILVVLQTAIPSRWSRGEPVLRAITDSVRRRAASPAPR